MKKKKYRSGAQGCRPVKAWARVTEAGVQTEQTGSGRILGQNPDPKWAGQPSAQSRGGRRAIDGTADHQLPSSVGELLEPNGEGYP